MLVMGFFGDALKEFIVGSPDNTVAHPPAFTGQRLRYDDQPFREFYRLTHFDFGLPPLHTVKHNTVVPMKVHTTFGNKIHGFEIHGNILHPLGFMSMGWGSPFHTINREVPLSRNMVWAYDITRLHEGILAGTSAFQSDQAYLQSEEYLMVLRAVGNVIMPTLTRVPSIELEFGTIWNQYGIPDGIFIGIETMSPLHDRHLEQVINVILHGYRRGDGSSVTADYTMNSQDGTLSITMRDAHQRTQPPQPNRPPQAGESWQAEPNPEPADNFPYEFYRGLGLIDDEDMVLVPVFGPDYPMRASMTSDLAREHLMKYQPEN
jgi:hypothetical protein